jgi:ribosomal subunit interface protein
MQIPLQITFHGVAQSDALKQYVRKRFAKLDALTTRVIACRVALEQPHRHAQHGRQYRVRIDVTVPGGEVVVEHTPVRDHSYEDAYAAVDAAFQDASRRLHDYLRRRRGDVKHHENARRDGRG